MDTLIETLHFEATPALLEFIREKADHLEKLYKRIESCKVIVKPEPNDKNMDKLVEITVNVPNKTLFASEQAETYELAADRAISDLKQQLRKYKEKQGDFTHSTIDEL